MKNDARPSAVRWSERLGLTAALFGMVREVLIWDARTALDGTMLALIFTAVIPIVMGLLVLLVTRRRSKIALATLVVLAGLAWLTTWKLGLTDGSAAFTAGGLSLVLQSLGLLLMATPAALRWLRGRNRA